LIKRAYAGFDPYITATGTEIEAVAGAGVDVVAFDATARERPGGWTVAAAVAAIRQRGLTAMADCATAGELRAAAAAGADIVATTLCGYTAETRGAALPALDLLPAATAGGAFAILEGGVASPDEVRRAFAAGAGAVVVGTAISDIDAQVRRFAQAATPGRA
jgi:N-acylglucosamine-6-phosphate 2-epimerase